MNLRLFWISIFSTLLLVVVNEYNLSELNNTQNKNQLIYTADQPSYLAPALNFKFTGVWKDNSVGFSSYYQRPPGYGFLFFIAHSFSNVNAFLILKIIQILLFGVSVYLFGLTLNSLKIKQKTIYIGTIAYGILPFFSTFTYFALSESILPFTVISIIYLTLRFNEKQTLNSIFILGLFIGLALLIRPQIGFLVLPVFLLFLKNFKKLSVHFMLFVALAFLPFLSWNVRNYTVNKEWVGIHPIYHYSNNHMYRPLHKNMSDLFRIWESNSASFHSNMAMLFKDTTAETRNSVLRSVPKKIREKYGQDLNTSFKFYQQVSFALHNNFERNNYLKENEITEEISTSKKIALLTSKIKADFWFTHHFITPTSALKEFVASSHLGLYIYQSTLKGNTIMEIFRWSSFIFLGLLFVCSLITLFISNINKIVRTTLFAAFIYLSYLIYFQRMNEERYYYILFPLFFVGSLTLLNHFFDRKRSS